MLKGKFKLAISMDFFKSYSEIPKKEQKDVRDFMKAFKEDPTAPRFNYENIEASLDKNFKSVRINYTYRAIVLKPQRGNVYMLLWVDHHDKAYRWARNKRAGINTEYGGIQVYTEPVYEQIAGEQQQLVRDQEGLFGSYHDRELRKIGVTEELIESVRSIRNEEELEARQSEYPFGIYESIFKLACGFSIQEIENDRIQSDSTVVLDEEDFEAALETDDSKQRFYVVQGEEELMAMLDAPLERWRVFLHPSQRQIVEMDGANGPVRVLGGPGTGKTVVAMHRARWLVDHFSHEKAKILFTTFNRNMAADIRYNLAKLCNNDQLETIEVINLDAWVAAFLKEQDYHFTPLSQSQKEEIWEQVLKKHQCTDFSKAFLAEEYDKVIRVQNVKSLSDFLKASRIGRGQRISRQERAKLWPLFETYMEFLKAKNYLDFQDLFIAARELIEDKGIDLPYKSIIVDEAQDISAQAFQLLRAMIPEERKNDLFITGDGHQRIYDHKVILSHCGINIRGRSRRLKINYRTTEEIRNWSTNILTDRVIDDLDGGADTTNQCVSLIHGIKPQIHRFSTLNEEMEFIKEYLMQLEKEGVDLQNVCLTARINSILGKYIKFFEDHDIECYKLHPDSGDDRNEPGLRIATMHRVKGLEFDHMIVASANDNYIPLKWALNKQDNATAKDEKELQERCLLYVATTRAKKEVIITGYGKLSRFIIDSPVRKRE